MKDLAVLKPDLKLPKVVHMKYLQILYFALVIPGGYIHFEIEFSA